MRAGLSRFFCVVGAKYPSVCSSKILCTFALRKIFRENG